MHYCCLPGRMFRVCTYTHTHTGSWSIMLEQSGSLLREEGRVCVCEYMRSCMYISKLVAHTRDTASLFSSLSYVSSQYMRVHVTWLTVTGHNLTTHCQMTLSLLFHIYSAKVASSYKVKYPLHGHEPRKNITFISEQTPLF